MRVEVNTVQDFCDELAADAACVHRGIVRVRTDYAPEQDEQITFAVRFCATALMRTPEGDYVLECMTATGSDSIETGDREGTLEAETLERLVRDTCEAHDLTVRRGKIEVW